MHGLTTSDFNWIANSCNWFAIYLLDLFANHKIDDKADFVDQMSRLVECHGHEKMSAIHLDTQMDKRLTHSLSNWVVV